MTTHDTTGNAAHGPDKSNVHRISPSPTRVQPPDDWVPEGPFGHMAFEAGEGGRLVRLADVLRWLQAAFEIPRSEALRMLCDKVPVDVMGWLYWVRRGAYADPVPVAYAFGFETALQAEERRAAAKAAAKQRDREAASKAALAAVSGGGWKATQDCATYHPAGYVSQSAPRSSQRRYTPPPTSEPGQPALLMYLQSQQAVEELEMTTPRAGSRDDGPKDATTLSIRLDKARALWDYGVVTVQAAPVAAEAPVVLSRTGGATWSDEERARLLADYEKTPGQTEQAKRIALGKSWGMKPDNVKKQVAIAKKKAAEEKEAARERQKFTGGR